MRDDFTLGTRDTLAKRVGYRCSNPNCRLLTSGPQKDPSKTVNVGIAAHITAASQKGPRYDENITSEQRQDISNGIWLCQNCAKLVDNDSARFSSETLRSWKTKAESAAIDEIEGRSTAPVNQAQQNLFIKVEKLMPELIEKMRNDLRKFPIRREFVLLQKGWSYWARGHELIYYFDDHADLMNKMRVLQNKALIQEITFNSVKRYVISEEFAEYLSDE